MDESVFLYWWFSFDLLYYLVLGGTNNALQQKFLWSLWSLALAKKSCNNIIIAPRKFPDFIISWDYGQEY